MTTRNALNINLSVVSVAQFVFKRIGYLKSMFFWPTYFRMDLKIGGCWANGLAASRDIMKINSDPIGSTNTKARGNEAIPHGKLWGIKPKKRMRMQL